MAAVVIVPATCNARDCFVIDTIDVAIDTNQSIRVSSAPHRRAGMELAGGVVSQWHQTHAKAAFLPFMARSDHAGWSPIRGGEIR